MEITHLRFFVAVVEQQSFSKAAIFCRTSVSNLSEQIQTLEKDVGNVLLDRNRRQIVTTEAGEELLPHARRVLTEMAAAQNAMRTLGVGVEEKVSVGVLPCIAPSFLSHVLNSFFEQNSNIQVHVYVHEAAQMLPLIEARKLDMGIASLPIRDNGFGTETLYSEEMLLALYPRHFLTRKRVISGEDLLSEKFIVAKEGAGQTGCPMRLCKQKKTSPQIIFHHGHLETVQSMVAAGNGISIIPESAITDTPVPIIYRQLVNPQLKRSIAIVTRKKRAFKPSVLKFYKHILQASQTFKLPTIKRKAQK